MNDEDGDSVHTKDDCDRESQCEWSQREATEVEEELTSASFEDVRELRARHDQLQDDVEVLAAHLEKQTLEHEKERSAMRLLQNQLQHANMEMARELHSFRIENDALRRQNALLQQERDDFMQKTALATETHDELLLALKKQQQVEGQLQSANVLIVRERAQVRKALEATQVHCRRLEEELAALQTLLMQLQSERAALQAAAAAITSRQQTRESEQIKLQDEMIGSLRADLLQMEFEYKTLALDQETLSEKLSKLQRRLHGGDSFDVVPLGKAGATVGAKPLSSKQLKQLQKDQEKQAKQEQAEKQRAQQQQQQQQKKLNIRPVRNHYESENGGFSGVMELPNFIREPPRWSSSSGSSCSLAGDTVPCTTAAAGMTAPPLRRRSSVSALVSKTVSSAKKKLFAQHKIVLPQ
ncbi:hypothetical protein PybrP1_000806 [[Pythium] brassicae (nom. inval.)]|nr:hypothetical protein PybrP1_000806 [[Pythium] brassicae (nom. inval.)]